MKRLTPILFLLFVFSCDDIFEKEGYQTKLTGRVLLKNQTDHSNVVVYIDTVFQGNYINDFINKGTITDKDGYYSFTFDENDSSFTGINDVYYFINGFEFKTAQIEMDSGLVILGAKDVDDNGSMPTVELAEIYKVTGQADKELYHVGDSIHSEITFTNVSDHVIKLSVSESYSSSVNIALFNLKNEPQFEIVEGIVVSGENILSGESISITSSAIIPEGVQWQYNYHHILPDDYIVSFTGRVKLDELEKREEYRILNWKFSKVWQENYKGPFLYGPSNPNKFNLPVVSIKNDNPSEDYWVKTSAPDKVSFDDIVVDDDGYVYATVEYNRIYISSDGGKNWALKILDGVKINNSIKTFDNRILLATNKGIIESTDHGSNWQLAYFDSCRVNGLNQGENGFIYVGSDCGNYRSTDNGETWTEMTLDTIPNINYSEYYLDFFAITKSNKLYAGNQNWTWGFTSLYYSTDYGENWKYVDEPFSLCGKVFVLNSKDNAFISSGQGAECGPAGLWRSNNFGQSWSQVSDYPHSIEDGLVGPDGHVYYVGYYGIFYSKDDGESWVKTPQYGLGWNFITGIAMSHDGYLFIVTDYGGIYYSANPIK
ncbi:MAG: hypothetical protein ISR82_05795 [Candidatus Marinimicrobia bacterium]|nr:hypothetical protein [Candidatus Neomarinimicrobiota bacterium]MBL7010716.1 hypothetical protein [Candidatus Neomarinimicrobiota bacterium]MBL7029883.1 hypothetical protein [Candidatus Neomarinimicrobiota bacterium]